MSLRKVTVGIDGSPASRTAITWAAERCRADGALLELLTVVPGPAFDQPDSARNRLEANLAESIATVKAAHPGISVAPALRAGAIAAELEAASADTDLLVVGSDSKSRVRRLVYGTVPLRLAALSDCPLVVVPGSWRPGHERIVLAVGDGSPAPVTVDFATAEAEARDAPLDLLHVWSAVPTYPTPLYLAENPWHSAETTAQALVGRALEEVAAAHPESRVTAHLVEGPTVSRLVEAAETAQLLVIGRHARGILRELLQLGSVAHDVLLTAPSPVAVIPGHRQENRSDEPARDRPMSSAAG